MPVLGYFLNAVAGVLHTLTWLMTLLMIARAVLSWVNPDPYNPIVQFIYSSTEPLLVKVREKIPPFGMMDLSVIAILLGLYFIDAFLVSTIAHYGRTLIYSASVTNLQ